jgi:hypothetical protein
LTLVLIALGSAVGFSSISPWPSSGVSAKTFQISAGLYLVFTAMVASTIGGYISGRLRTKWTGLHTYEVQFRDTAHGFLAWALATIFGAAVLGGAATYLIGAAAGSPGTTATSQTGANSTADYYAVLLLRPSPGQAGAATPNTASSAASGADALSQARSILVHDLASGGDVPNSDRTYLAQLISTQTGMSQGDAEKRVSDVLTQAKSEADQARQVAAAIAIWLTIAMFVGAFSASLAAIEGGQLRD